MAHNARVQAASHLAQPDRLPRTLLGIDPLSGLSQRVTALSDPSARVERETRQGPAEQSRLAQRLSHLLR